MLRLRFLPSAFALLIAFSTLDLSAQSPAPPDISRALNALADEPPSHTGFVFDRSMLQAAQVLLQSSGMDAKRAAAALSSISYDNYRYAEPAVYNHDSLTSIMAKYHAAGWQHLVDGHEREPGASQKPRPITDLWLQPDALTAAKAEFAATVGA